MFELFLTNELLNAIILQTKNYALFKNSTDLNPSIEEFKLFIAILILSGYNCLPSKRNYWEKRA